MMRTFVLGGLLLWVGACSRETTWPSLSSPFAAVAAETAGVYVSVVDKGQVNRFVTRLADERRQIVVTKAPVDGAHDAAYLVPHPGERLLLVELTETSGAPLPGELRRFGRFAALSTSPWIDPHTMMGRHDLYAVDLSGEETEHDPEVEDGVPESYGTEALALTPQVDIDQDFLRQKLAELVGDIPVTIGGQKVRLTERRSPEGRSMVRTWLKEEYQRLGFTTTEHRYGGGRRLAGGANFVASRSGADPEKYLILSAHLDSVGNAGADDDGTGMISALAVAQALRELPLRYELRILGFDQEENGLVGSAAYAKELKDQGVMGNLVGNINLEMTGYDSDGDGGFHVIDCQENTSAALTTALTHVLSEQGTALEKIAACTNRSDHASFWRYNRPAIVVSENFFGGDGNPCYHRACDLVDKVNFDYMQKITALTAMTVGTLVGRP